MAKKNNTPCPRPNQPAKAAIGAGFIIDEINNKTIHKRNIQSLTVIRIFFVIHIIIKPIMQYIAT